MRAVQSICMITLFVLRPAGGGHPGCAGRSHPATDLPRNANHAAGITGEQQQPRPRGRHRSARPGRLRNDPALLLRRDCKNTQEPSGVTESRPSSHRSGHDRRGVSPSPPGVVARTGPLRSSGPVSGPMASHTRCWGTTPDHRPPRERQRRCRRYEPAVGPAQPGRSTSRNAQERRATETVLAPPGDGTTPMALLSPLVQAAARFGEHGAAWAIRHVPVNRAGAPKSVPRLAQTALEGTRKAIVPCLEVLNLRVIHSSSGYTMARRRTGRDPD
jgi:hypothetical protein